MKLSEITISDFISELKLVNTHYKNIFVKTVKVSKTHVMRFIGAKGI